MSKTVDEKHAKKAQKFIISAKKEFKKIIPRDKIDNFFNPTRRYKMDHDAFQVLLLNGAEQNKQYEDGLYHLLVRSDLEFVPPLSSRGATTQKDFREGKETVANGPRKYLENVLSQNNIVVLDGAAVVGFMSFRTDYRDSPFDEEVSEGEINHYISTLAVLPEYRKRHIASGLYDQIEELSRSEKDAVCVSTRTWSTNFGHIRLLEKRGFRMFKRIENDRCTTDGVYVDTVYFIKRMKDG